MSQRFSFVRFPDRRLKYRNRANCLLHLITYLSNGGISPAQEHRDGIARNSVRRYVTCETKPISPNVLFFLSFAVPSHCASIYKSWYQSLAEVIPAAGSPPLIIGRRSAVRVMPGIMLVVRLRRVSSRRSVLMSFRGPRSQRNQEDTKGTNRFRPSRHCKKSAVNTSRFAVIASCAAWAAITSPLSS